MSKFTSKGFIILIY